MPPLFLATMRVDAMALEQRAILFLAERPARGDVDCMRHGERRVDGIDAPHEIDMLRRRFEGAELLPPEGEENTARRLAERFGRIFHRVDLGPDVAGRFSPWRPAEREQGDRRGPRRLCGIGGDGGGIRMGGIDQHIDLLGAEIGCEPFGAAETAAPHRNRLLQRLRGAACERQSHGEILALGERASQFAGARRAAKDEDAPDAR